MCTSKKEKDVHFVTEKNIFLPMRDGVRLATDVYRPAAEGRWPVLLARLMYDKSNEWFLGLNLDMVQALQAGYAIVVQDTRGRYASEGEFSLDFRQESTDGADTIAWIAQRPWSTGNVGMFGGSQLGLAQWLAAREQPAALLAMAPMIAPSASIWHQGGALRLGAVVFVTLSQVAMGELQRRISQGRATPSDGAPLLAALGDLQRWYEHGIWQSKQCLSYLPGQVLRLSFQNRLLLPDKTMYVASLMEGVYNAATKGR
jgi:putative CocE/NonD family hydrolase